MPLNASGNLVKIINVGREYRVSRHVRQTVCNRIDVVQEQKSADNAQHGTDNAQHQSVIQDDAPKARRMPMSLTFSETIIKKMVMMEKPQTAIIKNSKTFITDRSISTAAKRLLR